MKKAKAFYIVAWIAAVVFVICGLTFEHVPPGTLKAALMIGGFIAFILGLACVSIARGIENDLALPRRD